MTETCNCGLDHTPEWFGDYEKFQGRGEVDEEKQVTGGMSTSMPELTPWPWPGEGVLDKVLIAEDPGVERDPTPVEQEWMRGEINSRSESLSFEEYQAQTARDPAWGETLETMNEGDPSLGFQHRAAKLDRDEVMITGDSGGSKAAKVARMDLIDPEFLWYVAEVMGFGLAKYGKDNWKGVDDVGLFIGAAQRHIALHHMGEVLDPESGRPHLAHATAVLMMAWWIGEYGGSEA